MKLAMSQIKLFIVRLLQNYTISANSNASDNINMKHNKISNSIETKDVFFNGPIEKIKAKIHLRHQSNKKESL